MNRIHGPNAQETREHPEPQEGNNPVPWVVIGLTAFLMLFGIVYILRSNLTIAPELGDGRELAELRAASPGAGAAGGGAAVDGAAAYTARCAACHQAGGTGLPGVFPPLAQSEYVTGKESTLIAVVLHGIEGPLTVKGQAYNGSMPAFAAQVDDAELAALLTHVRSQWGNSAGPISAEAVAAARADTADRNKPYQGDAELTALK
ncbi:MAG: cytochrome c [Pseudomonadota bacterium]|nr:cytochrome c [Pseudomonadota bacterium]